MDNLLADDKSIKVTKETLTVLLTACINPDGMSFTKLQDPEIRYRQYIDALKFYLEKTDLPIVFIDNSGVDISDQFPEDIQSNRLEVLSFSGNTYNKELGKGFGEMLIIEYALKHSAIINSSDFILKITGRHKVLNISSIIKQAYITPGLDIMANLREMLSYVDSGCWLGSKESFEILVGFKEQVNDSKGANFEHFLLKTIHRRIESGFKFYLIKNFIRYQGMSGTTGHIFNHSWPYWCWKNLRYILRFHLIK